MFPEFLGIGAQKAGTTWLHENLRRHPQIWLPPVKELHYLDHKPPSLKKRLFGKTEMLKTARQHLARQALSTATGAARLEDLRWAWRYCLAPRSDDWYSSLFPRIEGKLTGEICPGYARMDEAAVARVHRLMPDARIIYLLRDPIGRAWSTAVMHFRKPRFGTIERYDDERIKAHLADPKTLVHGDYLTNLRSWRQHYSESQIFIGFFDELRESPGALLRRILEFLALDANAAAIPEDVAEKRNAGKGEPIPEQFRAFLAELHHAQLVDLDRAFRNAYTKRWLQTAEAYLERA